MELLIKNEKEANVLVAKVMRITFLIFTLVCTLNLIGIFVIDGTVMLVAYIGGTLMLMVPTLLVNILKQSDGWVKYVNVICVVIFTALLCVTLNYHVVALYAYPIAIASLYFSKRLNIIATIMTVISISVGQLLAFHLQTVTDDNFHDVQDLVIFGIVPRALVLIAVAAVFTTLCGRTASMLSSLLGADEQEKMLNRMKKMQENAEHTSSHMVDMMEELSGIAQASLTSNQQIATEANHLLDSSTENAVMIEHADQRIQDISGQLTGLSNMNHKTAQLTDRIGVNTQENQKRMDDVTSSMEQMHSSTNECKQIISNLGEESKEIIGIIQTITSISSRTNILALNATIEAARAGEHGKGFAVVAEEIQKLSEQTKTAVENIGSIVHEVVRNTEDAVVAMERNAQYTQHAMQNIQKANESSALITTSNQELIEQVHAIDKTAAIISEKSEEVADRMRKISDNIQKNCNAVEEVTAATQENTAGTENLAEIVERIRELSETLEQVIQND